jgi:hypothetical protein
MPSGDGRLIDANSSAADTDAAIELGHRNLESCRARAAALDPGDTATRLEIFVEMAHEADFQTSIGRLFPERAAEVNRLANECLQLARDMNG